MIGIYKDDILSHLVNTIEESAEWIGCSTQALYKSFHVDGVMSAKGFTVDRIDLTDDDIEYHTFLVGVNIDNVYDNYIKVKRAKITLSEMSDNDLLNALKKLKYHDKIIWSLVDLNELRFYIKELE